jgi:HD-like signal output (HDOD) protein
VPPSSSNHSPPGSAIAGEDAYAARDRLLRSISEENDLPTLGSTVARVVQLASSDDEAVHDLASFVLSDVALTQKILRLANTAVYRSYSGGPITTVSKAIFVLGFDTVKTSALAMLLVDCMSGNRATCVRTELAQALSASVIGREMARRSHFKDAEEAAVAALFKNMGRLLVAAHDHVSYNQIDVLIEAGNHTPAQASTQILGCSFDMLAESVLSEWKIPDSIIKALNPLPQGILKPAKTRQEWMQQVVAFSATSAKLIPRLHDKQHDKVRDAASRALLTSYGSALNLESETLSDLFTNVAREIQVLTDQLDLTTGQDEADDLAAQESADEGALEGLLLANEDDDDASQTGGRHPSGKPVNARTQLLAGIQDVTEMMASGRCKVNDLIMLALETIYRGMGFRFATVCLNDTKTAHYRARISLGENNSPRQAGFVFSDNEPKRGSRRDIFQLAMEKNADLMISDAGVAKIQELIPAWHRALLPDARSFVILPLVVQKRPFGFFYAYRAQPAPEGVPPDEAALIRTLKGQVLAALNAR